MYEFNTEKGAGTSRTQYFTAPELARRWGVHPNSIRNYVSYGWLQPTYIGQSLRFAPSEVERFERSPRLRASVGYTFMGELIKTENGGYRIESLPPFTVEQSPLGIAGFFLNLPKSQKYVRLGAVFMLEQEGDTISGLLPLQVINFYRADIRMGHKRSLLFYLPNGNRGNGLVYAFDKFLTAQDLNQWARKVQE